MILIDKIVTWWQHRQEKATKSLVTCLLPTVEELRDVKLGINDRAYSLGTFPPEGYNSYSNAANRILKKRDELGYIDDDGIAFTVPIIDSHCCGEKTRLVTDIKGGKFKNTKVEKGL